MKHLVICGAPHSGKSSRAIAEARPQDVIWDFDAIAEAMLAEYDESHAGKLPLAQFEALMELRRAFVQHMRDVDPDVCRAIVTVVDRYSAERLAGVLDAELVDLGGR